MSLSAKTGDDEGKAGGDESNASDGDARVRDSEANPIDGDASVGNSNASAVMADNYDASVIMGVRCDGQGHSRAEQDAVWF